MAVAALCLLLLLEVSLIQAQNTFHVPERKTSVSCLDEMQELKEATIQLQRKISDLEKHLTAGENKKQEKTGNAVYIRWGRTVCPTNSELLYPGYMVGVHHHNQGGTSDRLCVPEHPQWEDNGYPSTGWDLLSSYLYGVKIRLKNDIQSSPFKTRDIDRQGAPCAVCLTAGRTAQTMLPAHTKCPEGWTMEYKGYLMSSYSGLEGRPQTAAVCLDQEPEAIPGVRTKLSEGVIYFASFKCGILPCPPYIEREVACVVCSL